MISEWLHQRGRDALLVFCAGWGMDARPFRALGSSNYDVLICFNYSAQPGQRPDIVTLSQRYHKVILLAWSMGVAYAQQNFVDETEYFAETIALNGTLRPIDDDFGIPEAIFQVTLDQLNEEILEKFYRRMFRSTADYERFLPSRPQRSLADQRHELALMLQERISFAESASIYNRVVIADKDLIVPSKNQLRFWQNQRIRTLAGGHFPFYAWRSWDDLIDHIVQS